MPSYNGAWFNPPAPHVRVQKIRKVMSSRLFLRPTL